MTTNRTNPRIKVQIVGAFNTGTNLIAKAVAGIFDVDIHKEGHTLFWKHTCLTPRHDDAIPSINNQSAVVYVVVVKHPYWWFHSIKKSPYSLTTSNPDLPIGEYLKQRVCVQFPKMKYATDVTNVNFDNFVDYYNRFYDGALNALPKEKTVVVRYTDFIEDPMDTIFKLADYLPVKGNVKNLKKNAIAQDNVWGVLKNVFNKPTKSHGNPRHGPATKKWYKRENLNKLFKQIDYDWINDRLDKNLLQVLGYRTSCLVGIPIKTDY